MSRPDSAASLTDMRSAYWILVAGMGAALHIGKLPPALPVLDKLLGISLVQAGFLLSLVQLGGMLFGLMTGLAVQRVGLRRSMIGGLCLLGSASVAGSFADSAAWLLVTRALEGLGFLWAVLPAPGLLRQFVPKVRINSMLGLWATYMPVGTALALLLGPWAMQLGVADTGWRIWWRILAGVAFFFAIALLWLLPAAAGQKQSGGAERNTNGTRKLLLITLRSRAVWMLALTFGMYSGQWLAIVGFLPTVYAKAGIAASTAGLLTALAAALNLVGNVMAGRLLERGVAAVTLLITGFVVMATGAMLAFGFDIGPWWQFAAVLVFSMVGGLIPATLFSLGVRMAPVPEAVSPTVGWMQQWSSAGQFLVPPFVAWVAVHAGGWQWTGWVSLTFSIVGIVLALRIRRQLMLTHH